MSSRTDLNAAPGMDVDAILEEFYRQESEPAPALAPRRSRVEPRYTEPETPQPELERPAAEPEALPSASKPKADPPKARPELPKPDPWSLPPEPHTPVTTAAMPPAEGTLLYEGKPAEETALYQGSVTPSTIKKAAARPKRTRRSADTPLEPVPDYRDRPSVPRKKKKRSRGLGFALMFVVLLLLAAALAALLRWNSMAEKDAAAPEPEALRLELGQSLESLLDEHAGTSR